MEYNQEIIEDGNKRTLAEFAARAIIELLEAGKYGVNEVVQQANSITELEHDSMTRPGNIHPLPEGYSYRFSGFGGQVIGIVKDEAPATTPAPDTCPACGGEGYELGTLGRLNWKRCRACGLEFHGRVAQAESFADAYYKKQAEIAGP